MRMWLDCIRDELASIRGHERGLNDTHINARRTQLSMAKGMESICKNARNTVS